MLFPVRVDCMNDGRANAKTRFNFLISFLTRIRVALCTHIRAPINYTGGQRLIATDTRVGGPPNPLPLPFITISSKIIYTCIYVCAYTTCVSGPVNSTVSPGQRCNSSETDFLTHATERACSKNENRSPSTNQFIRTRTGIVLRNSIVFRSGTKIGEHSSARIRRTL